MYNSDGIIQSVVDQLVPERGNTYSVSMFFPNGFSVCEIESLPTDFELNSGTWVYDGTQVYQDAQLLADAINKQNTQELYSRLMQTSSYMWMLQSCAVVGVAQTGDDGAITTLQQYAADLRSTDLAKNPAAFPSIPAALLIG